MKFLKQTLLIRTTGAAFTVCVNGNCKTDGG